VADETAGWKTYTNAQYGFEIKYPDILSPSVSISTSNGDKTLIPFNKYLNDIQSNIESEKNENSDKKLFYKITKNFELFGKKAFTYEYTGSPARVPSLETLVDLDGVYVLRIFVYARGVLADVKKLEKNDYSDFRDLENINNAVLSTFKFTK
jgi:hypothetical protein